MARRFQSYCPLGNIYIYIYIQVQIVEIYSCIRSMYRYISYWRLYIQIYVHVNQYLTTFTASWTPGEKMRIRPVLSYGLNDISDTLLSVYTKCTRPGHWRDWKGLFHYCDVIMGTNASRLFGRWSKNTSKFRVTGLCMCGELTGDRWIPRTNGQ